MDENHLLVLCATAFILKCPSRFDAMDTGTASLCDTGSGIKLLVYWARKGFWRAQW